MDQISAGTIIPRLLKIPVVSYVLKKYNKKTETDKGQVCSSK